MIVFLGGVSGGGGTIVGCTISILKETISEIINSLMPKKILLV
jgi:hypothetical protein